MLVDILPADLSSAIHTDAILDLLNDYASGLSGGGTPLPLHVRTNLIPALQKRPNALVLLGFADGEPAALAICFEGFSTFACRPLLNIHDFMVAQRFRGRGLGRQLLAAVEQSARERGCCKLTLEVLEGNTVARQLYTSFGFAGYTLDPAMGSAQFWQKTL